MLVSGCSGVGGVWSVAGCGTGSLCWYQVVADWGGVWSIAGCGTGGLCWYPVVAVWVGCGM